MSESYDIGWKYKKADKMILLDGLTYISLPVNSAFSWPSSYKPLLYDADGTLIRAVDVSDLQITGYNMSKVGFQVIKLMYKIPETKQYVWCYGVVHVFGDTTWRVLWEGSENIKLDAVPVAPGSSTTKAEILINGEQGPSTTQARYACATNDPRTFDKYIGWTAPRKIRIYFTITQVSNMGAYINDKSISTSSYFEDFIWDYSDQADGSVLSGSTNYNTVFKTIGIYRRDPYTGGTYGYRQLLVGQIYGFKNEYISPNLLVFDMYTRDAEGNPVSGHYSIPELVGQEITITKIQVRE